MTFTQPTTMRILSWLLCLSLSGSFLAAQPTADPPTLGRIHLGLEVGVPFTNYRFQTQAQGGADVLDIRSPYRAGFWLGLPVSWRFQPRWALRLRPALSIERNRVELGYPGDSLAQRLVEPYNLALPLSVQWSSGPLDRPHLLIGLGPSFTLNLRREPDRSATPDRSVTRRLDAGVMGYLGLRLPVALANTHRFFSLKVSYFAGLGNVLREAWPIPTVSVLNQQAWLISLVVE